MDVNVRFFLVFEVCRCTPSQLMLQLMRLMLLLLLSSRWCALIDVYVPNNQCKE